MNELPKSPATKHEGVREPLVGGDVLDVVQAGRGDLSDWVELMEAVEALCPVGWWSRFSATGHFDFDAASTVICDQRARRRTRRHGYHVSARPDPGRVDVLRAQEARRGATADRCQYVPAEGSWWGDCRRDRADPQKGAQIADVKRYGEARNVLASDSLKVLQATARNRRNMFEQAVEAMKYNSLGQISHALFDMGEEHLRNM